MHEHRPFAVSEASRSLRGRRRLARLAPYAAPTLPGREVETVATATSARTHRASVGRDRSTFLRISRGRRGAGRAGALAYRQVRGIRSPWLARPSCSSSGSRCRSWSCRSRDPAHDGRLGEESRRCERPRAAGHVARSPSRPGARERCACRSARGRSARAKKAAGKTAPGRAVRPDAPPAERTARGPRLDIRTCRTALSRN